MDILRYPISALLEAPQNCVLAVISGVDGPSYRPVGAMMAILADGTRVGSLSSGCIESDLVLQAEKARATGKPLTVLYGQGSPFMDIKLPCGGGLEILLLPNPDRAVLAELVEHRAKRRPCTAVIDTGSGAMAVAPSGETGRVGTILQVRLRPEVNFFIFGKGPEASTFAALVQSAGYDNLLLSPDDETLSSAQSGGSPTVKMKSARFPASNRPDRWSAVVLFFHDHEWEPPILKAALGTAAFYIGAQGSQRARDNRLDELANLGVTPDQIARLKGPIGLVPSARDARTLAVSVLAEILSVST
ncbi:MAG: XdhC family protein [Alphaproteobacteria bacterium]|nr:XdhC family protein [Alphaproteobacteria bacterium]